MFSFVHHKFTKFFLLLSFSHTQAESDNRFEASRFSIKHGLPAIPGIGKELAQYDIIPVFLPLRMTDCKDQLSNQHLTVLFWFPSDHSPETLRPMVSRGGMVLHLFFKLPSFLLNPTEMNEAFVDMEGGEIYPLFKKITLLFLNIYKNSSRDNIQDKTRINCGVFFSLLKWKNSLFGLVVIKGISCQSLETP